MSSKDVKNFFFPSGGSTTWRQPIGAPAMKKNLSYYISPLQFARIKNDIQLWREAIVEAEQAYYPHRVRMQRIYQDTILNEHIEACVDRRKGLTLLRDFKLCSKSGTENKEVKEIFMEPWFENFQNYALDALFYGYSLISMGDIINNGFPDLSEVRRQNISPDRKHVTNIVYSNSGLPFDQDPYKLWHVWVPTPSELGISTCGYGLFYKIAKTEIYLRNNTAFNADGIEIFGQPIRKGKTTKTEEGERAAFESALRNMGSSAYILLDEGSDELELVESKSMGTGYQIYGDFEKRNEAKISKVILGHADALDSTPGKLGGGQGDDESPADKALNEKQQKDGTFMTTLINTQLIPRLQMMGFNIPIDLRFEYDSSKALAKARKKEDDNNEQTAKVAETMSKAGLEMDAAYFQERTGIPTKKAAPKPVPGMGGEGDKEEEDDKKLKEKTKNRLKKLYA